MHKLLTAAIATASVLGTAAAAEAQVIFRPCYWAWNGFMWVCF